MISLSNRWIGPGIRQQIQEKIEMRTLEEAYEGSHPGRLPRKRAQAARSRRWAIYRRVTHKVAEQSKRGIQCADPGFIGNANVYLC